MNKMRLDTYLTENGFVETRSKAQAVIMAGWVYVNNQKCSKSGYLVKNDDFIEIRENNIKYVSRGGLKLEKAIIEFCIDLCDKRCMDIGASTGGFTDCMLQHGAASVTCVDVGYGQLAWKIRNDPRVINFERTNIRYIDVEKLGKFDFVSIDVSFISLKLIFPVLKKLLNGECVALIKPQFEAGKEKVGKGGIVKDKNVHIEVIDCILKEIKKNGLYAKNLIFSPIRGAQGNIEYLIHLSVDENCFTINVSELVEEAHKVLKVISN